MRSPAALKGRPRRPSSRRFIDAIEAYEAKQWPLGKDPAVPGGKG
jgi:hypothetical protein